MVIIERYEFTYQDYLNYCDSFYCHEEEEEYLCVAESETEYIYDEETTKDKKHDKIFKDILQDKEEMAKFLTSFVGYNIKQEQLELYNSNYITKKFEYKNADIVYRIKEKNIYFLVEHQTKVDYSMAYRILNYCVEIIRSIVNEKETSSVNYKYPKVIPIVLYTGKQKWTASKSFSKMETEYENFKEKNIDIKYKLIDINQYNVEDLLKEKTLLANALILEKCKNIEDVLNNLKIILKNTTKVDNHEELKRIVIYLYKDMKEEDKKEIIKLIEEKESESEEIMITARRIINEEIRKGKIEGILETLRQTIERMIKMNFEDDTIKQATGAKKSEIEKIRKTLQGEQ